MDLGMWLQTDSSFPQGCSLQEQPTEAGGGEGVSAYELAMSRFPKSVPTWFIQELSCIGMGTPEDRKFSSPASPLRRGVAWC